MITKRLKYRGMMMTELIVSMTVLGMLMIAFAISLDGFRRLNHYYFTKQRCVSAAQASLDSIAATGKPIDEVDLNRLWPGIVIKIEESQGSDQWKGLKLISISAKGTTGNKKVEVRLSRYFLTKSIAVSKADNMPVLREH
jgi:hypothetical protein